MSKRNCISILLLDDSPELVRFYKRELERSPALKVTIETDSYRARSLAEKRLFDIVIIDAKLEYRGLAFGGLGLADDLKTRYGRNAIIVISRFITPELMREYGADYEFLAKDAGGRPNRFCAMLCQKIREVRERQYIFVAMPFAAEFENLYDQQIARAVKEGGFKCLRVDKILHNRPIHEVIFEHVEQSKLVIFVADGANPNAYYEAGFANAMRKEVIIVAKSLSDLKLDVAHRYAVVYGNRQASLRARLKKHLIGIRFSPPLG